MVSFFKQNKRLGYFLSGLVILFFGMIAINQSVVLTEEHHNLEAAYSGLFEAYAEASGMSYPSEEARVDDLIQRIRLRESWMYWSVIAIGLIGFVLAILNAEKLRKLDDAHQEKKETLKLLESRLSALEVTLDGIGLIDQDGRITYLNQAFIDIYGLSADDRQQFIGEIWVKLYAEEEQKRLTQEVLPALQEEGVWHGLFEIKSQDGRVLHIDMALQQLEDGSIISTARDVSDRLEADAEKKEMQTQLYQAQKMEAIGRLAGGIAHDFNNILAAMNGYAEFLSEDLEENTPQHGFAENILKAGHQAKALVDQMLTFSRHKGSQFEPMDLMSPVNESLAMLKASLPKTIEVVSNFDLARVPIEGNATQISQVVMNLCVNAKDAMENKGQLTLQVKKVDLQALDDEFVTDENGQPEDMPLISIADGQDGETKLSMGALVSGKNYICLSVEDSGSGMSRMIMENIFEPFFTTKAVDKGTGLGLSTVHGVVAGHSGALKINSTIGKGTRFELFFPMSEEADAAEDIDYDLTDVMGSGLVLLVEDQPEVKAMTTKMVERLGYTVETANNGLEALEAIRADTGRYDLVLTDHNMPKMTGLELVLQIHQELPDLPFILLSGYSQQKLQDMMREHPAIKAVLRKPISKQALGQKMAHTLAEYRARKTDVA